MGEWLPWLRDHCTISERTAQLYMRVAKNRAGVELQIRNGVADLTLTEAAALMVLTSDMRDLLEFMKSAQNLTPEEFVSTCVAQGIAVIKAGKTDPKEGKTDPELRECHLFTLLLHRQMGVEGAAMHVEWVMRRFQNPAEWLGEEGDQFRSRCSMKTIHKRISIQWQAFVDDHRELTADDIIAKLDHLAATTPCDWA
jgi:hypothetical protein